MSDLFGNHVGFPTRWLRYLGATGDPGEVKQHYCKTEEKGNHQLHLCDTFQVSAIMVEAKPSSVQLNELSCGQ